MRKKLILSLLLSPDLWKNLFFVLTSCYYSYSNLSYSRVTVDHLCRKKEFAQRHTLYLLYHANGNIQTSVTPAWKSINWVSSVNGKLMVNVNSEEIGCHMLHYKAVVSRHRNFPSSIYLQETRLYPWPHQQAITFRFFLKSRCKLKSTLWNTFTAVTVKDAKPT